MRSPYIDHQIQLVKPYVQTTTTLLDYGCGDMTLDHALGTTMPKLSITGIDVVDFHPKSRIQNSKFRIKKQKHLRFVLYDGKTIPFPNRSFDTTLIYHVFHHTPNPAKALAECVRVTKKRLIVVEPIIRISIEKYGFIAVDILANFWKSQSIPMTYQVRTEAWWRAQFRKHKLRSVDTRVVSLLPTFLPIGITKMWVLDK